MLIGAYMDLIGTLGLGLGLGSQTLLTPQVLSGRP